MRNGAGKPADFAKFTQKGHGDSLIAKTIPIIIDAALRFNAKKSTIL